MTTNKKLVVTVGVMAVALILALTGIIVVLVTANQRASSAVNVKYTSSDVEVTLSATAYLGSNTYQFTKGGVVGGETELVLSPTVTEGSLSQTSDIASFDLTKTNDYVVFEYVFQNKTGNIDVKIDQDGVPATKENINLTYIYSDTKITNFDTLDDNTEFTAQLLPAYTGEETVKYVYIKAQIADLLYDSSLVGDFGWALSKPQDSEINTVTLNVSGADLVERGGSNLSNTSVTSNYTYKTLAGSVDTEDISIYPAVANKAFVGWSETEGGTVISAIDMSNNENHNALRGTTTAKTLYPVYKDGSVPSTSYTYSSGQFSIASTKVSTTATEFIIPDYYSDGTNEGKVVAIEDSFDNSAGLLNGNITVTDVILGRYLSSIGGFSFYGTNVANVNFPDSLTYIGTSAFDGCLGLKDITIGKKVSYIESTAFEYCENLESVTISGNTSIGLWVFRGCTNLTDVNLSDGILYMDYGTFENCTALTTITLPKRLQGIDYYLFRGCTSLTSIVIPDSVSSIGEEAFKGCTSLTSVYMPDSVNNFYGKGTFQGCTSLTSIEISYNVVALAESMFEGCTALTSVKFRMPPSVEWGGFCTVGKSSFKGCTALTSIVLPKGTECIMNNAFEGCTNLTSVVMYVLPWGNYAWYQDSKDNIIDVSNSKNNATLLVNQPDHVYQCYLV